MKIKVVLLLIVSACSLVMTGCENNGDVDSGDEGLDGMRLVPASAHLAAGETVIVFRAEGGIPPYTWEVSNTSLGDIAPDSFRSETAIYTRSGTASGQNSVSASDSHNAAANADASWSAVAVVVQD